MTSPIKLSQNAQRDLRGLFGCRAMPKILAALDQLATTPADTIDTTRSAQPRADRVVFLHAHPDDEAIFTGGTIALLAAAGCSVTLVVATSGQLGRRPDAPTRPRHRRPAGGRDPPGVRPARRRAGRVPPLPGLGHARRSGQPPPRRLRPRRRRPRPPAGWPASSPRNRPAPSSPTTPAASTATPTTSRSTASAPAPPQLAGIPTVYESTVDRDYLHRARVPHLVVDARRTLPAELGLGVASAMVSTRIAVGAYLRRQTGSHRRPPEPGPHHLRGHDDARRRLRPGLRPRVVHPPRPAGRLDHLTEPAAPPAPTPTGHRRRLKRPRRNGKP